jgi:putative ABC transport system ATP-binding protein
MALARVSDLHKRYGDNEVLAGVSLAIEAGEWVAMVGRSGSGKSTLLHVLGGLDRDYVGEVEVLGQELGRLGDAELSRFRNREVGFVFQQFHLLEHLTVRENILLPAWFDRGPTVKAEKQASEALARVGLADKADIRPGALSGGQKQRVVIARALLHQPPLLLADEPTGNLDSETGGQLIELFGELNRGGLTLFVVTHEERVSQAARRVLRMNDGRIEPAKETA